MLLHKSSIRNRSDCRPRPCPTLAIYSKRKGSHPVSARQAICTAEIVRYVHRLGHHLGSRCSRGKKSVGLLLAAAPCEDIVTKTQRRASRLLMVQRNVVTFAKTISSQHRVASYSVKGAKAAPVNDRGRPESGFQLNSQSLAIPGAAVGKPASSAPIRVADLFRPLVFRDIGQPAAWLPCKKRMTIPAILVRSRSIRAHHGVEDLQQRIRLRETTSRSF